MKGQKVRVALLTTSFPLKAGSASGIFIQRLVKNMPTFVETTVITPCDTSPANTGNGYRLHCFRYAPWKWQILAHQPGGIPVALKQSMIMRFILPIFIGAMFIACFKAARKADIIHANWSVNGAIAGLVGFLQRKPVVTTLHGEDVTRAKDSRLYRYLLVWCLRSNAKVMTVSEAIYELLTHEFPDSADKIIFFPNGVDAELLNNPMAESKINEREVFSLLTVGSLIPRKAVGTIIDALSYVQSPQDFSLSVVGDGAELNKLREQVREKSLDGIVKFVGHVPPEKIIECLQKADALVLASYSEGRPSVVLESFAAGVPVIASDIEGVQELLRDDENGLMFKPGDAKGLALKIEKLQHNEELQIQFSKNGREFILWNHLLWENVGQKHAQLYNETIQN